MKAEEISNKPDGLKELLLLCLARQNVMHRLIAVVLNGMRVDGTNPNAT